MQYVHRPEAPEKRITSKNEFELCYLRHRYFRRVKFNPTEDQMRPYNAIVNRMARLTFSTYRNLFGMVGLEFDDLVNIGRVHLVNFLGLFAVEQDAEKKQIFIDGYIKKSGNEPTETDFLNKNKAHFTLFMKQRMEDMVRICTQKTRNIKGLPSEEFLCFFGPTPPPVGNHHLTNEHEKFGYKKIEASIFRAIKKIATQEAPNVWKFDNNWYVQIPVDKKHLTLEDLVCHDMDPYNNLHNMTPEQIIVKVQEDNYIDKRTKNFKKLSKKKRIAVLRKFMKAYQLDPEYQEEIETAQLMLENLSLEP